jgi:putative selenium metabolism hydrolase
MLNENLVKFCQKLIQAESISGNEGKVASLIKEEMTKLNYDEIVVDEYGNVIGKIKGNGNKSLMYDGHMDTVAIPDPSKWTVDPFGAEIIDGKMYGRGTSDMKCALGTMIYAAARLKEEKVDLKGDVYIAAVVFEEIFEGMGLGKILDKITPSAVVIGEASRLTLNVGQRGRAEIVVETEGVNAHSSSPEKGVNAVYSMAKLIPEIQKIEVTVHEKLGKGIFELTDLKSSPYPGASVVPDKCRSTYDRRLLVGESQEDVLKPVLDVIKNLKKVDSTFSATAKFASAEEETYQGAMLGGERFFPAWLIDEDSEIVKSAVEGMKNANMEPKIQCYSFCTDGSESAGRRGIPTIGIGPSLETLAHVVDEYIELSEIEKAEEIYFEISKAFLK